MLQKAKILNNFYDTSNFDGKQIMFRIFLFFFENTREFLGLFVAEIAPRFANL